MRGLKRIGFGVGRRGAVRAAVRVIEIGVAGFVGLGFCVESFIVKAIEFLAAGFEEIGESSFWGGVAIGANDLIICLRDGLEKQLGGASENEDFARGVAASEAEGKDTSHEAIDTHDAGEAAGLADCLTSDGTGFGAAELLELAIVMDAESIAGAAGGAAATASADEDVAASEVLAEGVIDAMTVLRNGAGCWRSV